LLLALSLSLLLLLLLLLLLTHHQHQPPNLQRLLAEGRSWSMDFVASFV